MSSPARSEIYTQASSPVAKERGEVEYKDTAQFRKFIDDLIKNLEMAIRLSKIVNKLKPGESITHGEVTMSRTDGSRYLTQAKNDLKKIKPVVAVIRKYGKAGKRAKTGGGGKAISRPFIVSDQLARFFRNHSLGNGLCSLFVNETTDGKYTLGPFMDTLSRVDLKENALDFLKRIYNLSVLDSRDLDILTRAVNLHLGTEYSKDEINALCDLRNNEFISQLLFAKLPIGDGQEVDTCVMNSAISVSLFSILNKVNGMKDANNGQSISTDILRPYFDEPGSSRFMLGGIDLTGNIRSADDVPFTKSEAKAKFQVYLDNRDLTMFQRLRLKYDDKLKDESVRMKMEDERRARESEGKQYINRSQPFAADGTAQFNIAMSLIHMYHIPDELLKAVYPELPDVSQGSAEDQGSYWYVIEQARKYLRDVTECRRLLQDKPKKKAAPKKSAK